MTDTPEVTMTARALVTDIPQVHEFVARFGDPIRRFRADSLHLSWTLEQGRWKLSRAVANGPLILKSGSLSSTITGKIEYGSWHTPSVPGDIQAIVDAQQALLPEVTFAWPEDQP